MDLLKQCNVRLVFLGHLHFGVLNWRPRPLKPKPKNVSIPDFKIVEEYTIDEQCELPAIKAAGNVGTNVTVDAMPVPPVSNQLAPLAVSSSANPIPVRVGTVIPKDFPTTSSVPDLPEPIASSSINLSAVTGSNIDLGKFDQITTPAASGSSLPREDAPVTSMFVPSLVTESTQDCMASTKSLVHVETPQPGTLIKTDSDPVTPCFGCPEDGLALSQYPWKRTLTVKLNRLQDITIDIWCNQIGQYYSYVPPPTEVSLDVKPLIVKGYGSRKRPSTADIKSKIDNKNVKLESNVETENTDTDTLLSHAKSLIKQAKTLVSKPVGKKPATRKKGKAMVSTGADSHVEAPRMALDMLHQNTMDTLTPKRNKPSTKSSKECTIQCKMCTETFTRVKDLNDHHRDDHGAVECELCDKKFSTQSSLDKHVYTQGDLKHVCELCGQCFPFESHLEHNSKVHINQKLSCPVKTCTKEFKGVGDLNRHIRTHKKGAWYCCLHCDYKNKDKRNTASHMHTHTSESDLHSLGV